MRNGDAVARDALPGRVRLLRDLVVFQFKLFVDGFRDLVLSPISLALGAIGFVLGGRKVLLFYDLLRMGRRSERVIDLFSAADRLAQAASDTGRDVRVDDLIDRVEQAVVSEYRRDRLSEAARRAAERSEPSAPTQHSEDETEDPRDER